jgi:hypothetical protein
VAQTSEAPSDIEETDLNVKPFAFKPHQLASLIYPKSLEKLGNLGGVDGLLRGLGTNPCRGVKITGVSSRDPEPTHPVTPLPLEVHISLAGIPERLQSTASLGGGSSAGRPASSSFQRCLRSDDRGSTTHIWTEYPSPTSKQEPTSIDVAGTPGQSHSKPKDTRSHFLVV